MTYIKRCSALALSALIVSLPLGAQAVTATDTTKPAAAPVAAAAEKVAKEKPLPYAGTVAAVDKAKQAFTFKEAAGERTFVVTAETKVLNTVTKQPAKFDDIAVGAYLTGSYFKKGDVLEAHSVHLGKAAPVKVEKKPKATAPATPAAKP